MNKRVTIVLLALLVIGGLVFTVVKKSIVVVQPSTVAEAKTRAGNPLPDCLEENKKVGEFQQSDQNNIVNTLTAQLTDVPAGTGANVVFSTYNEKTATGTEVYDGDYGSYNFSIKKDSSSTWKITSFEQCN